MTDHALTRRGLLGLGGALAAAAAVPATAEAAPAPSWPSVNLDGANSRHNRLERRIGPDTVARLTIAWQATDLKASTSVPAVVRGVLYAGGWDGTLRAYAAATGKQLWSALITADRPDGTTGTVSLGQVNSSPAVAHGRVYASTGNGWVHALDARTGAPVWKWQSEPIAEASLWSSPVVVGRLVIVGTASNEVFGTKEELVSRGSVVALDARTGRPVWRWYATAGDATSGTGCSVWSSAAVDRLLGRVYIGVGQNTTAPASPYSDSLVALDLRTGKLVWHRQYTKDDVFTIFPGLGPGPDFDIGASPNLFSVRGRPAVGVAHKGGTMAVFDRRDGAPIWARQLTIGSHLGGTMQTAAVDRHTVYVTSNTMVDEVNGESAANKLTVFALAQADGAIRWQRDLPAAGWGAVTLANGVLYVPTVTGVLYAFRASDGTLLTQLTPTGRPPAKALALGSGPTVTGGMLFTGCGLSFAGPLGPDNLGGVTAYALA